MNPTINEVHCIDCLEGLAAIEPGSIDLVFADPPFNIGYQYDVYKDNRPYHEYLEWSRRWMELVYKALKPTGTFWLAIGDEYAAELKLIAQREVGFHWRSWVIWYYTFGVNCVRNFSRSHTHLLYFIKHRTHFTFNAWNPAIRVPSARQLVYNDRRAEPAGRLPDNTWILRPQDVPGGFAEDQDTWYFPRVAGTFKEREGFHGCQMPEQLLGRIIRCCSNPLEIVLDPFAGSGTTLVVAKKLGRRWLGFDISAEYVERTRQRLAAARAGDPLDGPEDPLSSAPKSAGTPGLRGKVKRRLRAAVASKRKRRGDFDSSDIEEAIKSAYLCSRNGCSSDHVLADPELNYSFIEQCQRKGLPGTPRDWNLCLLRLRKARRLPKVECRSRILTLRDMDDYIFASEIAAEQLRVELDLTLDAILCDPELAKRFDALARTYSPGFNAFQYRWAALTIRKRMKGYRVSGQKYYGSDSDIHQKMAFDSSFDYASHKSSGVYLLVMGSDQPAYVGETFNIGRRLKRTQEKSGLSHLVRPKAIWEVPAERLGAYKWVLIEEYEPALNYREIRTRS